MAWHPSQPNLLAMAPNEADSEADDDDEDLDNDAVLYDLEPDAAMRGNVIRFGGVAPLSFSPDGRWLTCRSRCGRMHDAKC